MLIPPSQKPYNFINKKLNDPQTNIDPSAGQSQAVKDILMGLVSQQQRYLWEARLICLTLSKGPDGFFLDCGASDGEWYTNTLWVEKHLGWNGILIEADPRPLKSLLTKNRKAFIGNFCLSNTTHPQIVSQCLLSGPSIPCIGPVRNRQALWTGNEMFLRCD